MTDDVRDLPGVALLWSSYSLLTRRLPRFPTAAVGGFAAIAGALALLCHVLLEPHTVLSTRQWALIALLGLGPLGGAFFLWDAALKRGDPRRIGLLAFLTPLLSTALLMAANRQRPNPSIVAAMQWRQSGAVRRAPKRCCPRPLACHPVVPT